MSAFDLDRTLIRGNSSFSFFRYLIARGILPRSTLLSASLCYVQHQLLGMSLKDLHQKIFYTILHGVSLALLEEHVDLFVEEYLAVHLNPTVFSCLKYAQQVGSFTLILSNAPSFLVSRFAERLEVDDWRATEYGVDEERKLSHIRSILQGDEKALSVQEFIEHLSIDKKNVTAYSDSYLDLPFLLAAGTPVVVNPDKRLRLFSQTHQWAII